MEDKKKSTNIFVVIMIIIIFIIGIYFGIKYLENEKTTTMNDNTDIEEITPTEEDEEEENSVMKSNSKYEYYLYEEKILPEGGNEGEEFNVSKELFLFNDGKFYYSEIDYGDVCSTWYIGSYIINDNLLKLTSEARGGCDECYTKDFLSDFEFSISGNKILSEENNLLELNTPSEVPSTNLNNKKECK